MTTFGTWRLLDIYVIYPTIARDHETYLNENFDIIVTLHPPEVTNSYEEENFLHRHPSQLINWIHVLMSRIIVLSNTVVLCGCCRTPCLLSRQNEKLILSLLNFKFFFKPLFFGLVLILVFQIHCRIIKGIIFN